MSLNTVCTGVTRPVDGNSHWVCGQLCSGFVGVFIIQLKIISRKKGESYLVRVVKQILTLRTKTDIKLTRKMFCPPPIRYLL